VKSVAVAEIAGRHDKKILLELECLLLFGRCGCDAAFVKTALVARMLNCGKVVLQPKRFILMEGRYL
jgi:succinate-semialdehyde dehydrogenase/glutarate-semialdehyde dehydrogenase